MSCCGAVRRLSLQQNPTEAGQARSQCHAGFVNAAPCYQLVDPVTERISLALATDQERAGTMDQLFAQIKGRLTDSAILGDEDLRAMVAQLVARG